MYGIRSQRSRCGKGLGEDIHDCLQQKEELGGGGRTGILSLDSSWGGALKERLMEEWDGTLESCYGEQRWGHAK